MDAAGFDVAILINRASATGGRIAPARGELTIEGGHVRVLRQAGHLTVAKFHDQPAAGSQTVRGVCAAMTS